ncbi:hypothetical protein [Aquabacterium sp. OR-4]|uniref:hypothetical protein n=1 Tax=Aquabacterium sp. OR-4 TaxID=2978127 RepID=UPI0021B29E6D|nr:hypothetical protein [Aquabacterium sp. OR-4]MDT7837193.1 hypothetical protein [Aquabacterium sp. OR-4]
MILFWVAGIVLAIMAATTAFFFVLHVTTGEHVPLARAKALYRWCVVVVLGTFNIWIFGRVFAGIRALM